MKVSAQKYSLDNGLLVWVDEKPIGRSAACLYVNAGFAHDKKPETAHLVEHMQGIAAKVYGYCGNLAYCSKNASTSSETTNYYFSNVLPEHLASALENLANVFGRPHSEVLERERKAVQNEIVGSLTVPGLFYEKVWAKIFPKHHKMLSGIQDRLKSSAQLTESDCTGFFRQNYCPSNSILIVSGEIPEDAEKGIRAFEKIPRILQEKPAEIKWPDEQLEKRLEIREKLRQDRTTGTRIVHPVRAVKFPEELKKFTASGFLTNFLNASFGPLYTVLRDRKNLCYSLETGYKMSTGKATYFELDTVSPVEKSVEETEKTWLQALGQIADSGIPQETLDILKCGFKISKIKESQNFDFGSAMDEIKHGVGVQDLLDSVSSLTSRDVSEVAQMLLRQNHAVIVTLPTDDALQ